MGEDLIRKKPELLAPAGDMEKLRMAVLYLLWQELVASDPPPSPER